jgi:hypothetical protein
LDSQGKTKLSSAAKQVRERIATFLGCASDSDRIFYVLLTVDPLRGAFARALQVSNTFAFLVTLNLTTNHTLCFALFFHTI